MLSFISKKNVWCLLFIVTGCGTGYFLGGALVFFRAGGVACDLFIFGTCTSIVFWFSARILKKRWNVSYLHAISCLALGAVFAGQNIGLLCMGFEDSIFSGIL